MKWSDAGYNCGPYALHNALEALGITKSPESLAELCGTTPQDGTDETQLKAAIRKLGRVPIVIAEPASSDYTAWVLLCYHLAQGRPVLLAVDYDPVEKDASHWVAARGLLGHRVLVADSAHAQLELSYSLGELEHRWNCRGRKAYYGLVV